MHRRMFLISLLLGPMLVKSVPAFSASPERMVYRVQHPRYGNIGTYTNAVEKSGTLTTVTTEAHILVSVLGVVLYRQEIARQERWDADRLVSFHGVTTVNGKTIELTGSADGDRFVLMSPNGPIVAPASVRIANPWSADVLRGDTLLTPDRGRIENVRVKTTDETSLDINGRTTRTKHYEINRLDGTKRYEVWLDDQGTPVQFITYNPNGMVTFTLT
ncbi:MAG: hypothetical protein QOF03_1930 [Alphaproteobacteria bacterium]|nr:hypothetical protein [Alphaproteobacteria bacterium]